MTTSFLKQLSNNLNDLLKNSDEYNVIIEVGQTPNNQMFKAHSVILNSRCSYFKDKLDAITYNESNVKMIKQSNISVEVFNILIKYIYDGTISLEKVETSVIFDLLITSNEFGFKELVKHIQILFIENNTSWLHHNFSRVYQSSFKDNSFKDLQQFCANIISKHPNIIFDSEEFLTLPENILIFILKLNNLQIDEGKIWDYVIKWGIAQNPSLSSNPDQWSDLNFLSLKKTLQNCLPLIRYFQISGEDVFEKVRPYQKILEPTLWTDIMLKFMAPKKATSITSILPPRNYIFSPSPLSQESYNYYNTEFKFNKIISLKKSGETHLTMGRYEESIIDLTNLLKIDPNNLSALKLRGEAYRMLNRYEESLADLNKSLIFDPNNSTTLKSRGKTYYLMGKNKESYADLAKSLQVKSKPRDALSLRDRGETYRMMGKYNESITDLTKSLEIDPNNAFALKNRGETYRLMRKDKESLIDLNKSLEIEPNDAFALKTRGATYCMMGRYEESLLDLTKSLEINPNDISALKNRGETYCMMGRYEESLLDLTKSLKIKPNDASALRNRGETYRILGRYRESLLDLTKSLKIKPDDSWALKNRGVTYRMLGRYEDALADLTRSLEINPSDVWALGQREITLRLMRALGNT